MESQRLISLSLGKIAQSRGQRGGLNLHKNLLVATVLHKARAAYMEAYNSQQCVQKAKPVVAEPKEFKLPKQQPLIVPIYEDADIEEEEEEPAVPSGPMEVEVGQTPSTTPVTVQGGEARSTPLPECQVVDAPAAIVEFTTTDKENSPPSTAEINHTSNADHLSAATKLAEDAMTSSDNSPVTQQTTSGSPTCNGILKRRRDNPKASQNDDSPVVKKAKVNDGSSLSHRPCQFTPLNSTTISADSSSSDESDSDSDSEVSMVHSTDSPQITNLVSIFNSGFAGLCANNEQDNTFTPLTNLRPESPSPSYSRMVSESSLMCSSEVGRLGSLQSAIVLSA